jgi:hypothetical protein
MTCSSTEEELEVSVVVVVASVFKNTWGTIRLRNNKVEANKYLFDLGSIRTFIFI